jgi:hypothetical protein
VTNLKEIRVSITWTIVAALVSGAAGVGGAWVSLEHRIASLERDLGLRDAFQAEMKSLRDSIESASHSRSDTNDKIHDIDLTSIKLAMAKAGIHVEN